MGNRHALRISARGRAIHQNTAYCSILRRGHLALLSAFHTSCPTFLTYKCLHSRRLSCCTAVSDGMELKPLS